MKCRYCSYEGKIAEFVEPKTVGVEKPVGTKRYLICPTCKKTLIMSEEEVTKEGKKE